MKLNKWVLLAMSATAFAACKHKESSDEAKRTVFFDKSGMDTTVKPGDDFALYASGNWFRKTKIPASEDGWGSFYILSMIK